MYNLSIEDEKPSDLRIGKITMQTELADLVIFCVWCKTIEDSIYGILDTYIGRDLQNR